MELSRPQSLLDESAQRTRAEQVYLLYQNSNTGFAVSITVGAMLVVALRNTIPVSHLSVWYASLLAITAIRYVIYRDYFASDPSDRSDRRWEVAFLAGTGGAGIVWGSTMIFLFPGDAVTYQVLIALVLAGMVGGSVAVFAPLQSAYLAFALPILVPGTVRFLVEGDAVHAILALMIFIFLLSMTAVARNAENAVRTMLELRFDNQGLTAEINERKRVELALLRSEERFRDFAELAADFYWELDSDLRFTDISNRFSDVSGLRMEQVLGQKMEAVFASHTVDDSQLTAKLHQLGQREPFDEFKLEWVAPGRTKRVLLLNGKPVTGVGDRFLGYRCVGRDVTEEHHLAQEMTHQAKHDALTGLVNRREFTRRLETALAHGKRSGSEYVLCYMDLDQFKVVNDTAGHGAGDELLKQLTSTLLGRVRGRDTLGRFGGDEFGLLLDNCELNSGIQIANSLLACLNEFRFRWEDRVFQVGASIGVVAMTSATETAHQVLTQADLACYTAKDLGRNRIHVYQADDRALARMEIEIACVSDLRDALNFNRFLLYCQPILSVDSNQIDHYELLLRLREKNGKLLSPRCFIPAAERFGIMKEIDRWVITHALRAYVERLGTDSRINVSINLSGNSLDDGDLLQWINEQFSKARIAPSQICFEVTETAAIHNLGQAHRLITELKNRGCRFALDDFGSGLSSFGYLKHLPVDYLKIDGGFVRDMNSDEMASAIVTGINGIGHVLGMQTVAECVENEAILASVKSLGVDYVQGYAIGEPLPLSEAALA
ncbi:MAG: EAL domain-containing protein [Pseudomonadota bacterium]|nr:EAL domain-containing protein [Pseudomonadota bacterium]